MCQEKRTQGFPARVWNRQKPAEIRCRRFAGTNFARWMRPRGFGTGKNRWKFLAADLRERILCGGCVRAGLEQARTGGNSLPTFGEKEFCAVDTSARVWGSAETGGNSLPAFCGSEFCAADASARVGGTLEPAEIPCRRFAGRNFLRRIRPRGFGTR